MTKHSYNGWTIGHNEKTNEFTANKSGFFTGYHVCLTLDEFKTILDKYSN